MVHHETLRVDATAAWARVAALLADACSLQRAASVAGALGLTQHHRVAAVAGRARADGPLAVVLAVGALAARRRHARIARQRRPLSHWPPHTLRERIPGEAARAAANRVMVDHLAVGADATSADTRVDAVGALAGQVGGALGVVETLGSAAIFLGVELSRGAGAGQGARFRWVCRTDHRCGQVAQTALGHDPKQRRDVALNGRFTEETMFPVCFITKFQRCTETNHLQIWLWFIRKGN